MNLQDLSNYLLEEAITHGTITLENRIIQLTGSQIISVLKFIHGKNIVQEEIEEENIPVELFTEVKLVCYQCHKRKSSKEFETSYSDPLGRVCNTCKCERADHEHDLDKYIQETE